MCDTFVATDFDECISGIGSRWMAPMITALVNKLLIFERSSWQSQGGLVGRVSCQFSNQATLPDVNQGGLGRLLKAEIKSSNWNRYVLRVIVWVIVAGVYGWLSVIHRAFSYIQNFSRQQNPESITIVKFSHT